MEARGEGRAQRTASGQRPVVKYEVVVVEVVLAVVVIVVVVVVVVAFNKSLYGSFTLIHIKEVHWSHFGW